MNIIEKTYSLNGSLTKRTKTDTIVLHHRAGDGDVEGVDRIHKNNGANEKVIGFDSSLNGFAYTLGAGDALWCDRWC